VFVAGIGTGGTIAGTGKYLKEQRKDVQIVGVDPVGSLYYDYFYSGVETQPYTYILEGIGEDFMPSTMDFQYVDEMIRVHDQECFEMTRRLVREEGIFAGASCGAAVVGALKYLRRHDREGMVAVVILPDSGRNYLSKVFNDKWMEENGFMDSPMDMGTVSDILKQKPKRALLSMSSDMKVSDAIEMLKKHGISQAPVMKDGALLGVLTERQLLDRVLKGRMDDVVEDWVDLNFCVVHEHTEITVLNELFRRFEVALVYSGRTEPKEIITRIDLVDYISNRTKESK
jgi:cystathionine beta-synthase